MAVTNLQVQRFPAEVHRVLKVKAAEAGVSLRVLIINLLKAAVK